VVKHIAITKYTSKDKPRGGLKKGGMISKHLPMTFSLFIYRTLKVSWRKRKKNAAIFTLKPVLSYVT
jgi:hypothetical protein